MARNTFGVLQEFQSGSETMTAYLERINNYFAANEIAGDKRVPVLLTAIGAKIYTLLRSLTAPTLPHDKSFDDLAIGFSRLIFNQSLCSLLSAFIFTASIKQRVSPSQNMLRNFGGCPRTASSANSSKMLSVTVSCAV